MNHITVISRTTGARRWEHALLERLRETNQVAVSLRDAPEPGARQLDFALAIGRKGAGLARRAAALSPGESVRPDLVVDLTGSAPAGPTPVLRLALCGCRAFPDGFAGMIAAGLQPDIVADLDGTSVAHASPMLEDRVWLGRMADVVLSAAITLVDSTVRAFFEKRLPTSSVTPMPPASAALLPEYLPLLGRGLAARLVKRITHAPASPWRVGYRFHDGPGVADTGSIAGAPFVTLPDDGKRFYADPFVAEHEDGSFLFVEEFPYETGKGVISVSELSADGRFGPPRTVLEERHHLSYPQVFACDGQMFMLPESAGGEELVLYRAERFPDVWQRDTVLLEGVNINDATLLVRAGRFWLFGTARMGQGSASDTMVVYGAPSLRGPWTPHRLNPIRIDRSASRPGGAFVDLGRGRLALPVQDGTRTYGGGLGLMELIHLDDDAIVWGPVQPVSGGSAWPVRGIHTLNRVGRLEVVDSVG